MTAVYATFLFVTKRAQTVGKAMDERWSSSPIFVLAAGGAAIGFNNFWQFPQLVALYGGGAFLIVYLLCVLILGVPLLMAELVIGRGGRAAPAGALRRLAGRAGAPPHWVLVGGMATLGAFLILSYLSVIAGWVIAYALRAAFGASSGLTADGMHGLFSALVKDPEKQLFWHTLFISMTMIAAGRGVRHGLEAVARYAVPLLCALLLMLLAYAATTDTFVRATERLLMPDFTKLSGVGVLAAMSHAFFSLGLGAGVMLMYGAYLDDKASIPRLSFLVVGVDTLVGLVACLIVFSVVNAGGQELTAGPTLVFQSLPLAFDHLPFGRIFATLFFALLAIVAWVSAIALAEPMLAWLEQTFAMSRWRAALLCGAGAWLLGLISILSFSDWAFSFKIFGTVKKLGFFDVLQILTAQVLLPLSGILVALFAGWVLKPDVTRAALALRSPCAYDAWLWSVRLAIPLLLAMVLLNLPGLFA